MTKREKIVILKTGPGGGIWHSRITQNDVVARSCGFESHPGHIMFYVYILQSIKDGNFYIGYSVDLKARFIEHKKGKVFSTKNRRPMILIYYEAYRSEKDARIREKFLKTGKGREFIKKNIIYSRVCAQGAPA